MPIEKCGTENLILEWWGLPKSSIINECDYVTYVDIKSDMRLTALKHREKYVTQEDIDKRDEVLSVDYDNCDYDFVIQNDHKQETVDNAINKIQSDLERPSLKINMHLNEFESKKQEIIEKQNEKLGGLNFHKCLLILH